MHAALMPNGRVVFLDKIENYTQVNLTTGGHAYSSECDLVTNEVVSLAVQSNPFCSGGTFLANGTLLSVGGNGPLTWLDPTIRNGFIGLRYLTRSLRHLILMVKTGLRLAIGSTLHAGTHPSKHWRTDPSSSLPAVSMAETPPSRSTTIRRSRSWTQKGSRMAFQSPCLY